MDIKNEEHPQHQEYVQDLGPHSTSQEITQNDQDVIAEGAVEVKGLDDAKPKKWEWIQLPPHGIVSMTRIDPNNDHVKHMQVVEEEGLRQLKWITEHMKRQGVNEKTIPNGGVVQIETYGGDFAFFMLHKEQDGEPVWRHILPYLPEDDN